MSTTQRIISLYEILDDSLAEYELYTNEETESQLFALLLNNMSAAERKREDFSFKNEVVCKIFEYLNRKIGKARTYDILNSCLIVKSSETTKEVIWAGSNATVKMEANKQFVDRSCLLNPKQTNTSYLATFKAIINTKQYHMMKEVTYNMQKTIDLIENKVREFVDKFNTLHTWQICKMCVRSSKEAEYEEMVNFLFCISKKCLKGIFTFRQFRILKGKITLFVYKNKIENMSAQECCNHIDMKNVKLFTGNRYTREENIICSAMFQNFMITLFQQFYTHLINKHFYVTEMSGRGFRLLYFNKDWYQKETKRVCEEFVSSCKIEKCSSSSQSYGSIRALRKQDGFRIITNYKKVNYPFKPIIGIFRNILRKKYDHLIFGNSDRIKELKEHLGTKTEMNYIHSFDLSKCYDRIDQQVLAECVNMLFQEIESNSDFFVNKCIKYTFDEIKQRYRHQMCYINGPISDGNNLIKEIKAIKYTKQDISEIVLSGVSNHCIKYNNEFYRFALGIPQGMTLSTYLCALYQANLVERHFGFINDGLLLNYVDDFLFITSNKKENDEFLAKIENFDYENMLLNHKKTQTNQECVTWCGYKIYNSGFNIKYSYETVHFGYNFALPTHNPGRNIKEKIKKILQVKLNKLLISKKNPKCYENIYDIFLYVFGVLGVLFGRCEFVNVGFVRKVIDEIVLQVKESIRCNSQLIDKMAEDALNKTGLLSVEPRRFQ
ncbi:TERT [Enterospora canceri]|uniref:Telomerase reverse transcriptase n=1 Tax=Enterospora canceri TaxID=1081671 RepID=A0A1Y1S577_9MICR|nr:TERT [Enterospora canceri]